MTIIFKAKTHSAYTIKIMAELLQNNIKTACFEINENSIKLCMMDYHRTILIDLVLESENFTYYKFKSPETLFLGINLNHFHKMLKSIKKKDSMQLFIDSDNPTDLGIKVIPKENNRVTTSFVKIQEIQTLDIDIPTGYSKPIIVPSSDFQKMGKEMVNIGSIININAKNFHIKFAINAGGVMKRDVQFGERCESDEDDDDDENECCYTANFDTEQLYRITKVAGLGDNIQIYTSTSLPLLLKSTIGSLGKISIYIKSKDLINENQDRDYDESDNE